MIDNIIKVLSDKLLLQNNYLTTAESCTGGLVAKWITDQAGSSSWFERGLVTYSNQAKMDLLGVKAETLDKFGAVSQEVAKEMASGCLLNSPAQVGLAITGIAGPDGGSVEKPVGTVCFAWAKYDQDHAVPGQPHLISEVQYFSGDRLSIREAAASHALKRLVDFL